MRRAALLMLLIALPVAAQEKEAHPIRVASKPFGESVLLMEMFAQLLEARGFEVERMKNLGATEAAFNALKAGKIDVYPEYTGTGLQAILGVKERMTDPRAVHRMVRSTFDARWNIHWLPPLGFQNTFAICVRRETARQHGLTSLSDLTRVAGKMTAGVSPDFIKRPDGLPGLKQTYGLEPKETRSLSPAIKYQAVAQREVDFIDGYSTDGFIARYDLVVLADDKQFFPPYEAAAMVGSRMWEERPRAVIVLGELSGRLDTAFMQQLNRRHEVDQVPAERVAADALASLGLTEAKGQAVPTRADGLWDHLWQRSLLDQTLRHLLLVLASLLAAILLAVPLGLLLERAREVAETVIRGVGLLQTIPSIALLAFMIPLLGIGVKPAIVALWLYALFPIVRNTYTGVRDARPDAVSAAEALGMTTTQILRHVRLPLAAPTIMAGIRTAAVISVGTATLAAFIGAGGLGDPIVSGLYLANTNMILSGAIPAALLALAVDGLLALCEKAVAPRGL